MEALCPAFTVTEEAEPGIFGGGGRGGTVAAPDWACPAVTTAAQEGEGLAVAFPPGWDEGRNPVGTGADRAATPASTPGAAPPAVAFAIDGGAQPCLAPPEAALTVPGGAPHSSPEPPAGRPAFAVRSHLVHGLVSPVWTAAAALAGALAAPGCFATPGGTLDSPGCGGGLFSFLPEDEPPGMSVERPPTPKHKHPKPNP